MTPVHYTTTVQVPNVPASLTVSGRNKTNIIIGGVLAGIAVGATACDDRAVREHGLDDGVGVVPVLAADLRHRHEHVLPRGLLPHEDGQQLGAGQSAAAVGQCICGVAPSSGFFMANASGVTSAQPMPSSHNVSMKASVVACACTMPYTTA